MSSGADPETRLRAACTAQAWDDAAAIAISTYGNELMGYLVALVRNVADADDLFAVVCESMWKSLPAFRWDSTFRTYLYVLARHAHIKYVRDPRNRRRASPLESPSAEAVAAEVRSRTATYLRTETKDKIAKLRAKLDPEDQTLLILRINRLLTWREIARVMGDGPDDHADDAMLDRRAASLRKRFERLKTDLRAMARD